MRDVLFAGYQDEEDGWVAADGCDGPEEQDSHHQTDPAVGREPGEVIHRAVSLEVLHVLPARIRASKPKGDYCNKIKPKA